jgi:hypothetical protein
VIIVKVADLIYGKTKWQFTWYLVGAELLEANVISDSFNYQNVEMVLKDPFVC